MKRVRIVEKVKIPDEEGNVREVVKVSVVADYDEESGEYFLPAESIRKIDLVKARHMGLLLPSEIKALRMRFGKTQTEMCDLLGLGARTWTRWETNHERPTASYGRVLLALYEGRQTLESLCVQRDGCLRWASRGEGACYACNGTTIRSARAVRKLKIKGREDDYAEAGELATVA